MAIEATRLEMAGRLGTKMQSAIVQQMIPGGVEMMAGATDDPTFGHIVVLGAGGTLVELLADVAFRIHPMTDADADDMLREIRVSRLLQGYRGSKPCDVAAVREALLRLSAMLDVCPEIRELDINPIKALEQGAIVVDARVRIEPIAARPPSRRIAY